MTRINLVPVEELSDQHLVSEYKELPRCIKQDIDTSNAPERYKLGKNHMRWAKKHSHFLIIRYSKLCAEMTFRGFKVNYPYKDLFDYFLHNCKSCDNNIYIKNKTDITLSRQRLIFKYNLKPDWYRWTNRMKPRYYDEQ